MEIAKNEVLAVEVAVADQVRDQMKELTDIELALVGGGQGDINFG